MQKTAVFRCLRLATPWHSRAGGGAVHSINSGHRALASLQGGCAISSLDFQ
jgi:hypothetical protein